MNWIPVLGFFSWLFGGWAVAKYVDPAALQLYVVVTAFALILTNLGERHAGRSAYSVFNENCQPLMGQIQAEQFDSEVRHRQTEHDRSITPTRRRLDEDDHESMLERTRREILAEKRRARRANNVIERPRRRR